MPKKSRAKPLNKVSSGTLWSIPSVDSKTTGILLQNIPRFMADSFGTLLFRNTLEKNGVQIDGYQVTLRGTMLPKVISVPTASETPTALPFGLPQRSYFYYNIWAPFILRPRVP